MATMTIPEHVTEGQAIAIEVPPDSLANPCDSLLSALRAIRDTVYIHETVYQRAKAQRAVQAIREAVCQWEDIQYQDSAVVVTITRQADGTPKYTVTAKERKQVVPCSCKDAVRNVRRQRNLLALLLVIAALVGLILLKR